MKILKIDVPIVKFSYLERTSHFVTQIHIDRDPVTKTYHIWVKILNCLSKVLATLKLNKIFFTKIQITNFVHIKSDNL